MLKLVLKIKAVFRSQPVLSPTFKLGVEEYFHLFYSRYFTFLKWGKKLEVKKSKKLVGK